MLRTARVGGRRRPQARTVQSAPQLIPMKLIRSLLTGVFCAASLVTAYAQSANNNLANAFIIQPGATTTNGTTAGGNNREPSEALPTGLGGFGGGGNGNASGATVWHDWNAPASGAVTMTAVGTGYRVILVAWTGGAHPLSQLAANRAGANSGTATINFTATAGVSYKVMVDGSLGGTGAYSLTTPTPAVVPMVTLSSPANGLVVTNPQPVTLTASATSAAGTVTNVSFYYGANNFIAPS